MDRRGRRGPGPRRQRRDYQVGSGKKSRQFTFTVDVNGPEPVLLQEHDAYRWTPLNEELPVTDAVKDLLATFLGVPQ